MDIIQIVQNARGTVPNPTCCSSPTAMCLNCARLASDTSSGDWDPHDIIPVYNSHDFHPDPNTDDPETEEEEIQNVNDDGYQPPGEYLSDEELILNQRLYTLPYLDDDYETDADFDHNDTIENTLRAIENAQAAEVGVKPGMTQHGVAPASGEDFDPYDTIPVDVDDYV